MRLYVALHLAVAAAFLSACSAAPTDPSENIVETFTNTLPFVPGSTSGRDEFFTTSHEGQIIVTLVSVTPPLASGASIGVGVGRRIGSNQCALDLALINSSVSTAGESLAAPVTKPGDACVHLDGINRLTTDETYQLRVSHP